MATVALSTSSATLDPGTAYELTVLNSGTVSCHVQIGGGVGYDERLRPGQQTIIYPNGSAVTAFVRSGTGEVTTALSTNPETASSGGGAFITKTVGDGTYVQVVEHGATGSTARPAGAIRVFWRGTATPANATQYDRWINTTSAPYTESVYNGTSWDLISSGVFARNARSGFTAGRQWLFSGTSITDGTGASSSIYRWIDQATIMTGSYYVSNGSYEGGTPGAVVAGQLAALPARLANNPDAVFIEVGPNDASDANATTLASFQATMIAILALVKAAGVPCVVATPTPRGAASATATQRLRTNQQAQWLRVWAQTNGIRVADFHAAIADPTTGDLLSTYDSGDATHPNDRGHQRLAQVATDAMRAAMLTPLPCPVVAKGLGMANNPLMIANVTVPLNSFSVTATGDAPTNSIEADTTGRIPAGSWAKEVWTTVASAVTYTRGMTLAATLGSGWAVGDVIAISGYVEITDANARWEADVAAGTASARMFVRNQSGTNLTAGWSRSAGRRISSGVYGIGPSWQSLTIPVGTTSMDLTYAITLPVGAAITARWACLDLINLTALGLTADAVTSTSV